MSYFSSQIGNCMTYEHILALAPFPNHGRGDASCYPDLVTKDNSLKLQVLNDTFTVPRCFVHHGFCRQSLYYL